jgi:transcriptional regulator with XRE-family HTH domain
MYKEKVENSGKRIEKALSIRGMKQSELCKLADIPKSSLSLYLRGEYEPKQDRIYKMANILNVSEAWLMGYDVPIEGDDSVLSSVMELSDSEKEMLLLFRQIPESQQKVLLQMVRGGLETKR